MNEMHSKEIAQILRIQTSTFYYNCIVRIVKAAIDSCARLVHTEPRRYLLMFEIDLLIVYDIMFSYDRKGEGY